jgi:hypothetical protein
LTFLLVTLSELEKEEEGFDDESAVRRVKESLPRMYRNCRILL